VAPSLRLLDRSSSRQRLGFDVTRQVWDTRADAPAADDPGREEAATVAQSWAARRALGFAPAAMLIAVAIAVVRG
jgi:hypothetical protein